MKSNSGRIAQLLVLVGTLGLVVYLGVGCDGSLLAPVDRAPPEASVPPGAEAGGAPASEAGAPAVPEGGTPPSAEGGAPTADGGSYPAPEAGTPITGKEWHLDSAATGKNDGTSWGDAWTAFSAIDWNSIQPGDRINISGGTTSRTYHETLQVKQSGSPTAPITIARATDPGHDGQVIIDGQQLRSEGIHVRPYRHLVLSGFRLLGHTSQEVFISGSSGSSYSAGGAASHVTIAEMEIFTATRGVFIQTSDNVVVRGCTIETPTFSAKQTDGIYSQRNHDNVYDGNTIVIYNTEPSGHDDCIQLFEDTSTIVRNNYLGQVNDKSGNAQGIYATTMFGTTRFYNNVVNLGNAQSNALSFRRLAGTGTVEILGNTVYSKRAYHTGWITETPDPVVKNNIFFTSQGSSALDLTGWSGGTSNIDHNLLYAPASSTVASLNGSSKTFAQWQSAGLGAHSLNGDPQLTGLAGNDFHLPGTSPAVDQGTALGSPFAVDKEGAGRPQGAAWDIGAYER